MKNRSPITITIISAILAASIPAVFAQPSPIHIEPHNCHLNQQLPQLDTFTLFNLNEFRANDQKYYWFYAARYQDGSVICCVSQPDFNQPKLIPKLGGFIDKIVRDPNNEAAFIIGDHDGNGFILLVTNHGLDLSNPDRPKLTSLSLLQRRETLKEGESREHAFQGFAGQSITIHLESLTFHNITLFDTSGKKIAEKTGNFQHPRQPSELTVKLPADGTYKVVVKGVDRTRTVYYALSINSDQL